MNRTVKDATVKPSITTWKASRTLSWSFVTAYNFVKHLKALKWETPFQSICDAWKSNPSAFRINPHHLVPGPYRRRDRRRRPVYSLNASDG